MDEIIIGFITTHQDVFLHLSFFLVFFASFLESTPFFGFIIPAQTILILSGAFSELTGLNFLYLFIWAIIGSILGDILSFFAGKRYGTHILTTYGEKFLIKKEYIDRTITLLDTHLGKTLFLGRISSVPRSLAPFLAGASKIYFKRFLGFSILGGVLWSFLFLALGRLFAGSFEVLGPAFGKFLFIVSLFLVALISVLIYIKKRHFHIKKSHFAAVLVFGISLFILSLLSQSVGHYGSIKEVDTTIKPLIENTRNPGLTTLFLIITDLGDKVALISLTVLLSILLFLRKQKRHSLLLFFSMMTGSLVVYVTKSLFDIPRPLFGLVEETSKSFPSGHATLSIIFASIICFIGFRKKLRYSTKVILLILCISFPLLVGFSRLYLGVHWFSDVIGGCLLGLAVSSGMILLFDLLPILYNKIVQRKDRIRNALNL